MKNKLNLFYVIFIICFFVISTACKTTDKTLINENIVGTWEQFVIYEDYKKSLGFFEVKLNGKNYEMKLKEDDTIEEENIVKTKGIFNITYNGSLWTFNSDWGKYGISYIELKKINNNEFHGYVYLDGKIRSENLWIRVKN